MRALLVPTLLAAWFSMRPIRTVDGDTFVANVLIPIRPGQSLLEQHTVRLDCMNAPEKGQDGGAKATERLQAFLFGPDGGPGAEVLKTEWKSDKYGRLLGEPVLNDGKGFCPVAPGKDGGK